NTFENGAIEFCLAWEMVEQAGIAQMTCRCNFGQRDAMKSALGEQPLGLIEQPCPRFEPARRPCLCLADLFQHAAILPTDQSVGQWSGRATQRLNAKRAPNGRPSLRFSRFG